MKINIKATGLELTPEISDYIYKKIPSMEKYLGEDHADILAQVEVERVTQHHRTGEIYRAEVHVTGNGLDVYADARTEDILTSIDKLQEEITKELRRGKGKRFALARKGAQMMKGAMQGYSWGMDKIRGFKFRKRDGSNR